MSRINVSGLKTGEVELVRSYGGYLHVSSTHGSGSVQVAKNGHKKVLPLRVFPAIYTHYDTPYANLSFTVTSESSVSVNIAWSAPDYAGEGTSTCRFHYDYLN